MNISSDFRICNGFQVRSQLNEVLEDKSATLLKIQFLDEQSQHFKIQSLFLKFKNNDL